LYSIAATFNIKNYKIAVISCSISVYKNIDFKFKKEFEGTLGS